MENEELNLLRRRIEKLADAYFTIEEKILSEIKKLPNSDKVCDCEDSNRFCIVDDDVIACYCLNCGGEIYY